MHGPREPLIDELTINILGITQGVCVYAQCVLTLRFKMYVFK